MWQQRGKGAPHGSAGGWQEKSSWHPPAGDPQDKGSLATRLIPLSRALARILRHEANKLRLRVHSDGWCRVDELLQTVKELHAWTETDVREVVSESFSKEKARFELWEQDGVWIRAAHKRSKGSSGGGWHGRGSGRPARPSQWDNPRTDQAPLVTDVATSNVPAPTTASAAGAAVPPRRAPPFRQPPQGDQLWASNQKTLDEGGDFHPQVLAQDHQENSGEPEHFVMFDDGDDVGSSNDEDWCSWTEGPNLRSTRTTGIDGNCIGEGMTASPPSAASSRRWHQYQEEGSTSHWWWNQDDRQWFLERDPGPWQCFCDPESGNRYWWKDDECWFWVHTGSMSLS